MFKKFNLKESPFTEEVFKVHRHLTSHWACEEVFKIDPTVCCRCSQHHCQAPYRYVKRIAAPKLSKPICPDCDNKRIIKKYKGGYVVGTSSPVGFRKVPLEVTILVCKKCQKKDR